MNHLLFRTLHRIKHFTNPILFKTIRQVEQNQWLSKDEITALAWEKQKSLVRHAYMHNSFYRRKYDAVGFHPDELRHHDDFSCIPILTKNEIRENIEDIVCDNVSPNRLLTMFTGGSTGVPLKVYHDTIPPFIKYALGLRTKGAWGLKQGHKTATIWGLNRLNQDYLYTKQTSLQRFLKNHVLLDAFEMTTEKMMSFAELLNVFKPDLILSYVSAMTAFARFVDKHGGPGLQPKAICLTSEPIHDFQKELIEQVFQSTVFNQYGSVEIFYYASECMERNGLHINADLRTVEVVDEKGNPLPAGEMGQIVVTDLTNFAAPLIRYRNEDMASLINRTCPCGRGLPLMSKVIGRIYDMFVLPDGSHIYGHRFTTFFYDHVDEVSLFQVHQTHRDRIIVRVVPTEFCQQNKLKTKILESFRDYTKGQVQFNIRFVTTIDNDRSGKFRFAKSDVSNSYVSADA